MSFLKGKKVLIVGGNGFVGSRIASKLVQHAAEVSILSRHGPRFSYPENQSMNWLIGDIMKAQKYKKQINQADTVIHSLATLIDTSVTKFRQPGMPGTYQHLNRDSFLKTLELLENKKKIIYISAQGHPPFLYRYESTKKQSQSALFNSEHEGYAIRPGFIYDWRIKKWSIPLRHTIRAWNKFYSYMPSQPIGMIGKVWKELKQSQPTSLDKIAESACYIIKNGCEDKILDDSKIREISQKYKKQEKE